MGLVTGLFRAGAAACACVLIAGCGDVLSAISGGGKSGSEKTTLSSVGPDGMAGPAAGSISGVAMSGQLTGGSVRVFNFDTGQKGELLGEGPIDAQGRYRIDLKVRNQPILVEISGGRYIEPASARSITLSDGQVLLAVQNYLNGSTLTVSPTYYTTLAAALAENMVRMGARTPQAVVDANRRIPAIVGLASGFDAVAAAPVDISSPASVTPFVSTELEYGFATAALSSLTEAASVTASRPVHETINSIAFTQLALDDVRRDGVLDGQGMQGTLAIGVTPLSADIYRNTLALNVLRMASNTSGNKTSIGPAQLLPLAQRLNNSTDPIYGGRPIIPLNVDGPMIADLSIAPDALLAGDVTLTATATSVFGITSVEVLIDNVVVGTAPDPTRPSILFDTTTLTDGSHQLSVRATDTVGGRSTTPAFAVTISNAEGKISNISLVNNSVIRGTVAVTADIVDGAGIGQVRYFVDNFQPVISTDPRAPFQLDTVALDLADDRDHTFRITATNNLGREITSPVITFRVDNQAPNLVISFPAPGAFLSRPFTLVASATDNGQVSDLELLVDAKTNPPAFPVPDGFFINPENFPEGPRVLAVRNQDQAGNLAEATVGVTFDYTAPIAAITSPAQNAAIRGPFDIVATLSDNLALGATATTMLLDPVVSVESPVAQTNATTQGTVTQRIEGASIPPDGRRSYVVVALDQAGNTVTSTQVNVTIDNTGPSLINPAVEDVTPPRGAAPVCRLSGTFSDPSGVASASLTTAFADDDIPQRVITLTTPSFIAVITLSAGATNTITVTDALGNTRSLVPLAPRDVDRPGCRLQPQE